jgi:hypothetical protein
MFAAQDAFFGQVSASASRFPRSRLNEGLVQVTNSIFEIQRPSMNVQRVWQRIISDALRSTPGVDGGTSFYDRFRKLPATFNVASRDMQLKCENVR